MSRFDPAPFPEDGDPVSWHTVGHAERAHAFTVGDLRYAFCTLGPGNPTTAALGAPRCQTCLRRLVRIEAQETAWREQS